jgi:transposase
MRSNINLTDDNLKELKILKNKEKNNKIYRRYLYLEMSNKWMTNREISSLLWICVDTLTDWKNIFNNWWLEWLSVLKYEWRRESKLTKYKDEIKDKVINWQVATLKELQSFIKEKCDIDVEQSWLSRFIKKNSIFLTRKQK